MVFGKSTVCPVFFLAPARKFNVRFGKIQSYLRYLVNSMYSSGLDHKKQFAYKFNSFPEYYMANAKHFFFLIPKFSLQIQFQCLFNGGSKIGLSYPKIAPPKSPRDSEYAPLFTGTAILGRGPAHLSIF